MNKSYVKFKNSDNYYDSNTIRVLTSMMAAMQDDNEYKQLISQSTKVHNLDIKYSSFSSIEFCLYVKSEKSRINLQMLKNVLTLISKDFNTEANTFSLVAA